MVENRNIFLRNLNNLDNFHNFLFFHFFFFKYLYVMRSIFEHIFIIPIQNININSLDEESKINVPVSLYNHITISNAHFSLLSTFDIAKLIIIMNWTQICSIWWNNFFYYSLFIYASFEVYLFNIHNSLTTTCCSE